MSKEDFMNRIKIENLKGIYTFNNHNFYNQSLEQRVAKACWHAILDMDCAIYERDKKAQILQKVNKFICNLENKKEEGEIEK